jgi:Mrp family chromosome partitioning ATPase/capsular polysaccharide biosynthesis protein
LATTVTPEGRRDRAGLGPYATAVRAHPLIVAGITLLVVAATVGWLGWRDPRYESTAEILVTPLLADEPAFIGLQLLRESSDPTRVAQTAAEVVDSAEAAQATAARVPGYTRERVDEAVDVEPRGQSNVVAITARASDPRLASELANRFAESALETRSAALKAQVDTRLKALEDDPGADRDQEQALRALAATGDPTISLLQSALPPDDPSDAPAWLLLAVAVVAGLGLGTVAATLIELLTPRVRAPEEFTELYPLPTLGRIPRIADPRPGVAGLPAQAREAYRTIQVQLDQWRRGPQVIAIVSPNAGDGKTTTALNLALALVAAGRRVIVVEFDLRRPDMAQMLRVPAADGLLSLGTSSRRLDEILVSPAEMHGLQVAVAGTGAGEDVMVSALTERLPELLDEATRLADYVIVDTPPLGEVSDALGVVPLAHDVIVVARPDNTTRAGLRLVRELFDRYGVVPLGLILVGVGRSQERDPRRSAEPARSSRLRPRSSRVSQSRSP